jgi:hypothetical protein
MDNRRPLLPMQAQGFADPLSATVADPLSATVLEHAMNRLCAHLAAFLSVGVK